MKCRPVYKVVIELASGGRWDQHFIGRPTAEVLTQALTDEMIQRRGALALAGHSPDKSNGRYEDYITMVKHFWPATNDMAECHSCGTYVGGICITKEIVAILTESDPGRGAA